MGIEIQNTHDSMKPVVNSLSLIPQCKRYIKMKESFCSLLKRTMIQSEWTITQYKKKQEFRSGKEIKHCPILGFPGGSAGKESTCNEGGLGTILGLGRSPREGNIYPPHYSGLEDFMDCKVPGVAKSWTQTERLSLSIWLDIQGQLEI